MKKIIKIILMSVLVLASYMLSLSATNARTDIPDNFKQLPKNEKIKILKKMIDEVVIDINIIIGKQRNDKIIKEDYSWKKLPKSSKWFFNKNKTIKELRYDGDYDNFIVKYQKFSGGGNGKKIKKEDLVFIAMNEVITLTKNGLNDKVTSGSKKEWFMGEPDVDADFKNIHEGDIVKISRDRYFNHDLEKYVSTEFATTMAFDRNNITQEEFIQLFPNFDKEFLKLRKIKKEGNIYYNQNVLSVTYYGKIFVYWYDAFDNRKFILSSKADKKDVYYHHSWSHLEPKYLDKNNTEFILYKGTQDQYFMANPFYVSIKNNEIKTINLAGKDELVFSYNDIYNNKLYYNYYNQEKNSVGIRTFDLNTHLVNNALDDLERFFKGRPYFPWGGILSIEILNKENAGDSGEYIIRESASWEGGRGSEYMYTVNASGKKISDKKLLKFNINYAETGAAAFFVDTKQNFDKYLWPEVKDNINNSYYLEDVILEKVNFEEYNLKPIYKK